MRLLVVLYTFLLGLLFVIAIPGWVGVIAALTFAAYGWLTAQLGGRWPIVLALIPTLLVLDLGLLIATGVDCHPCSSFQNAVRWAMNVLMVALLVVGAVAVGQRFRRSVTHRPSHEA
jgi:hypothetical protein